MDQIYQKNGVLLKMEKANTTTEFPISLTNFSLKRYFCFFGPNLPKKCILGLKLKKCTPQNSGYSNLQKYIPNFSLNQQFWFLDQICPKRVFPVKNTENVHHHRMLHIYISLGTKFQLKLIILFFWIKFDQKGYFQKYRQKSSPSEFCIFKLA